MAQDKCRHNDSVAAVRDIIDNVAQVLFQEGVINKKKYDVLLTFTDKQTLDELINKFVLTMTYDVGVGNAGFVSHMVSRLGVADIEGNYQSGIENISSIDSYNAPRFTIFPDANNIVDYTDALKAIMAAKAKAKSDSQPNPEASDNSDIPESPAPSGS